MSNHKTQTSNEALDKLRAIAESKAAAPGRIQRGISWTKDIDDAVTRAMDSTGMDRSGIVKIAVAQLLGVEEVAFQEPA